MFSRGDTIYVYIHTILRPTEKGNLQIRRRAYTYSSYTHLHPQYYQPKTSLACSSGVNIQTTLNLVSPSEALQLSHDVVIDRVTVDPPDSNRPAAYQSEAKS